MHPIRFVKIYHKNDTRTSYRRFGQMWEDTNDSAILLSTQVLCGVLKKYAERTDIVKVVIDDEEYDKSILSKLY